MWNHTTLWFSSWFQKHGSELTSMIALHFIDIVFLYYFYCLELWQIFYQMLK